MLVNNSKHMEFMFMLPNHIKNLNLSTPLKTKFQKLLIFLVLLINETFSSFGTSMSRETEGRKFP